MSYEELKSKIVFTPHYIDVDKNLIVREKLSQWDIRELIRMMELIEHYEEAVTINKKVADLLMRCDVVLVEDGIGWKY